MLSIQVIKGKRTDVLINKSDGVDKATAMTEQMEEFIASVAVLFVHGLDSYVNTEFKDEEDIEFVTSSVRSFRKALKKYCDIQLKAKGYIKD